MTINPEVNGVPEPLIACMTALAAENAAAVPAHPARVASPDGVGPAPQGGRGTQPQPGPRPGEGLPNPSVGMNLAAVNDWTTELPFLDQMKHAREWIAHRPGDWGGIDPTPVLDANGWPNAMPAGATHLTTLVLSELPAAMTSAAGRYRLTWTGKGRLELWGNVRNVTAGEGVIHFDHVPNGRDAVFIDIREIDRTAPIRITGIVHVHHAAAFDTGEVFNPDWIALVRDFRVLRFMDWMQTNNSRQFAWRSRPKPGDYSFQRRGVPLEVMLDLANRVGADPWFCIPHLASADYIRRFATMVRNRLDKRLKAHFEYSNEVWNWMFDQAQWAHEKAQKLWPGYGEGWMEYYAGRAVEMARIVDAVYGAGNARAVNVITTHTGWQGLEHPILNAPNWRRTDPAGKPPSAWFDAYAVTGYFGHELANEVGGAITLGWLDQHGEAGALDRAFAALDGSMTGLIGTWRYHKAAADEAGLRLVMYEGGSHVAGIGEWQDNDRLTALFARLHRDPRMGPLYRRLLEGWREVGGQDNALFADVSPHGKYGPWGHLEHLDDRTPRWDALVAFNRDNPGWWEKRAAGTFLGTAA